MKHGVIIRVCLAQEDAPLDTMQLLAHNFILHSFD